MRIALVVPGGVDRSGEYRVVPALLALLERLAAVHEVYAFALHQERRAASWELAGARIHNVGTPWSRSRAVRALLTAHSATPFDLVHSIWSGASGFAAVCAARLIGVPSLVHVAGGEPVRLKEVGYGGQLRWRGRLQEAWTLRRATGVTAASEPMIELLGRLGIKAARVPLGVDLRSWPPQSPQPRQAHEPLRLVHVASLNRVKDQSTLLHALARLAALGVDFDMQIIGEDTLSGAMQGLAQALGLERRVHFAGFLPQRELRGVVARAHLMVISSRHEAGPLAVLEAAALGVPTVGTAVGHIVEWAPHAALAVPVGDSAALASAIACVAGDETLRLRLAHATHGRALAEDADFTASAFLARYEQLAHARN